MQNMKDKQPLNSIVRTETIQSTILQPNSLPPFTLPSLNSTSLNSTSITTLFATLAILLTTMPSVGHTQTQQSARSNAPEIDPAVERRSIDEFDIDSENVEIGLFAGVISIEDFGSDTLLGARIGYHINENFFIEASYGQSTAGETSFEILSGGAPFLTDEERDYIYYDLSVGYNFNGEVFVTDSLVFNTDFFITLGAGNTDFAGDERFTVSAGVGYRLLVTDYLSVRIDVRDHIFNSDIIGDEKSVHNLSGALSLTVFF